MTEPDHRIAARGGAGRDGQLERERITAGSADRLILQRPSAPVLESGDQLAACRRIEWRHLEGRRVAALGPGPQGTMAGKDRLPGHDDDAAPWPRPVRWRARLEHGGDGTESGILRVVPDQGAGSGAKQRGESSDQPARLDRRVPAAEGAASALEQTSRTLDAGQRCLSSRRHAAGRRFALHDLADQRRLPDPQWADDRDHRVRTDELRELRGYSFATDQLAASATPGCARPSQATSLRRIPRTRS